MPRPPRSAYTKEVAERIALRVANSGKSVGIDPATIFLLLSQLVPTLINCFGKGESDTAAYVRSQFNQRTGQYTTRLMRQLTARVRKQARRDGVVMTADEAATLATATLDEVRLAEGATAVRGAWREAPGLAQDDE